VPHRPSLHVNTTVEYRDLGFIVR